jgi:hypothetical protein
MQRKKRNKQLSAYVAEITKDFLDRHDVDQNKMVGLINPHLPEVARLGPMAGFYYMHGRRNPRPLMLQQLVDKAAGQPIAEEWARPILEKMTELPPCVLQVEG